MISIDEMMEVKECFWCKSNKFKLLTKRKDGVRIQECQNCKLIQVGDIPEDLSVYYVGEEYFNPDSETKTGYHENYDLLPPFYLYWQGLFLSEIASYSHKKSLLEVGCATGNAMEMVRNADPSIEVEGIDLSDYAISMAKDKGLKASVSTIEDFTSKKKFGIVFSSETMEHVDNVRSFIDGIKQNLEEDGVFVLYVPAVNKADLIEMGENYPSLTTSLEHVSYFTKEFLTKALTESFGAQAYVHQITTNGENYHLAVAAKDEDVIQNAQRIIEGFEQFDKSIEDADTLYNLAAIAAKFGRTSVAEKYLQQLEKTKYPQSQICFLKGIINYSEGHLIKAIEYFNQALGQSPASNFMLKVLLSSEKELARIYENELRVAQARANLSDDLEKRLFETQEELNDIKNSKIGRIAIKSRKVIGAILNLVRNQKKNL